MRPASLVIGGRGRQPWLLRPQFPYLRQAIEWRPIVATAAGAALLTRGRLPPVLVIAVVAAGLSHVLDDPAAAILDATPSGRARRRVVRLGLTLPVVAVLWLGFVKPLWALQPAAPAGAVSGLVLATLVAVVLAGSAVRGAVAGAPLAIAVGVVAGFAPEPWTLRVTPGDTAHWTIPLVVAIVVLAVASRDPAARRRASPSSGRSSPPTSPS